MTNFTEDGNQEGLRVLLCQKTIDALRQAKYAYFSYVALCALNIVLSITAFLGNTLIIVALQKESSLHPPTKLFFRCLASTDLCVGFVGQPLAITYFISIVSQNWKLCVDNVAIGITVSFVLFGVSLMTLTLISLDRLLALSLGLRYRQVVTVRRVRALVICVWLFWIANGVTVYLWDPPVFYPTIVLFTYIILCVAISTFCYVKIFLVLRQQQAQVQDLYQEQMNGYVSPNISRFKKALYALLWVQFTLAACCLPSVSVVGTIRGETHSFSMAFGFAVTLLFLNSTLNPIVYCWKIREVRQAVKETIKQFGCLSS